MHFEMCKKKCGMYINIVRLERKKLIYIYLQNCDMASKYPDSDEEKLPKQSKKIAAAFDATTVK